MSDVVSRQLGGLILSIDRLLCVGFGDCIDVAPTLFEFDAEGIVAFREPLPDVDGERLLQACEICPVDALTLRDAEGRQVAP